MFSSKISAAKRLLGMAFAIAWAAALPLLAQTSITSNDGGTSTAGNLYEAVTTINGTTNGGSVTLDISGSNSVTLGQPLLTATQNVTFLAGTEGTLNLVASTGAEGAVTFQQNLSLGSGVHFSLANIGNGGSASLDAGSLTLAGTGGSLGVTSGTYTNNNTTIYGGAGGPGGSVNAQSFTLSGMGNAVSVTGGELHNTGANGVIDGFSSGGGAVVQAVTMTVDGAGNSLVLTGGLLLNDNGGDVFNSAIGGGALVTVGNLNLSGTLNSLTVNGGNLINNGGSITGSSIGGNAQVYVGALTLSGTGDAVSLTGGSVNGSPAGGCVLNAGILSMAPGTLIVLNGGNSVSIGSWIDSGLLLMKGGGSLTAVTLTMGSEATVDFTGGGTVSIGDWAGSGTVIMGGGSWTAASGEFDGTLMGGGSLQKTGSGALTLTGANSYTGGTGVSGGTLVAANAGALGTGNLSVSGGTLLLSGPLTLDIGGSYTQSAAGTLQLGIGPTKTQWDELNVTGPATLAGTLDLVPYGSFRFHDDEALTILGASSVTGTFSTVTDTVNDGSISVVYNPTDVVLDVTSTAPSFQALGTSPNQKAIGAVLDGLAGQSLDPALLTYLDTLSDSALPGVYDKLSPASLTPLYQMGFATAQVEGGLVGSRISQLFGNLELNSNDTSWNRESPMFAGDMPAAEEASISKGLEAQRWGVFVNGIGNFGTITGDGNGPGYQYSTGGLAAGMDYRFGKDLVGGLLLGYSSSGTSQSSGTVNSNGGQVGLYAGWKQDVLHLSALVAGGVNSYTTQRQVLGGTASGNTQGSQFSGELNVSYDMKAGDIKIQPFVSGQYTNVGINAFTETGSMAPLSFGAQNEDYLSSDLGATAQKKFDMGGWSLTPMVSAAWEHVYQGNLDSLAANFGSGSNFTVNGPALGTDAMVLGLGANATLAKGMAAYVSYQGKVGLTNYAEQNLSLGANIGF